MILKIKMNQIELKHTNITKLPTNDIKNKDELDRIKTYKYYQVTNQGY